MGRLNSTLGLEPGELRPVFAIGAVHAAIGAAVALGDAAVHAIFIAREGAEALPTVLLMRALVSPLIAALYARFARPKNPRPVLALLALLAASATALGPSLIEGVEGGSLYAYAIHEVLQSLLTIHWGVYLLAHLDRDKARRGVALVYAFKAGGAACAGLVLAPLASRLGVPPVLYVAAGLFALVGLLAFLPRGTFATSERPSSAGAESRREGLRLLTRSPLLMALTGATVAMVVVRFTLRFQQQSILQDFDEHELAALLGVYTVVANIGGVALQLLVTGRLLHRFGVAKTNLLYASAVGAAQVALLGLGGIGAALFARFADSELKHALKTPVSPLFYGAFNAADRGTARAFVLGFVSPAAQVVTALALTAIVAGPADAAILTGLVACGVYLAATFVQNRAYDRTIARDSIRADGDGGKPSTFDG